MGTALPIGALLSILSDRISEPLDLEARFAPLPAFQVAQFVPSVSRPGITDVRTTLLEQSPTQAWWWSLVGALSAALVAPPGLLRWAALAVGGVTAVRFRRRSLLIRRVERQIFQRLESDYERTVNAERRVWDGARAAAQSAHEVEDALRTRLRGLATSQDVALAVDLLQTELSAVGLPLSMTLSVTFQGPGRVVLDVPLPAFDDMPVISPYPTPTGRRSRRLLSVGERSEVHRDICAGIALRLAWETFRILPFATTVLVKGHTAGRIGGVAVDAYPALWLRLERGGLERATLDGIPPSICLAGLGGRLESMRDGYLRAQEFGGEEIP